MPRVSFTVYNSNGSVNAAILVLILEQGQVAAQWRTIEIHKVCLCLNSLRVGGTILVQCCKVNQTLCCLQKRKQVVKAIKAVLCGVIYTETTPEPRNNTGSNHRKSACQTSNYGSTPKRHLTPWQYISDECGQNHNQLNNHSNKPHKFSRACVTGVVQSTKQMHINNNKE